MKDCKFVKYHKYFVTQMWGPVFNLVTMKALVFLTNLFFYVTCQLTKFQARSCTFHELLQLDYNSTNSAFQCLCLANSLKEKRNGINAAKFENNICKVGLAKVHESGNLCFYQEVDHFGIIQY